MRTCRRRRPRWAGTSASGPSRSRFAAGGPLAALEETQKLLIVQRLGLRWKIASRNGLEALPANIGDAACDKPCGAGTCADAHGRGTRWRL